MFKPTPEQSLAAMKAAAAIYRQRFHEKQQKRHWHLKSTSSFAGPDLVRLHEPLWLLRFVRSLPRKQRRT